MRKILDLIYSVIKPEENMQIYSKLDFHSANLKANSLADLIEEKFDEIAEILLEYESFEVVRDETNRALDLLRNLKENQEYFKLRLGQVTTFLPKNQPLYIFCCFVVYMSLMSTEVHFRIPHSMKGFFKRLLDILEISERFPNVKVSSLERLEFLKERSALYYNPETKETWPVTDMVIFTGRPSHAEQLKTVFDKRTLFITNGAGHNPMVVADDADLEGAVDAILDLQLYNQGQDCSAPNSILVEKKCKEVFLNILHEKLENIKVGKYTDRECRVGPISDSKDLVSISEVLIENQKWLDPVYSGKIDLKEGILYPTIVDKPLKYGGNYTETFAPIFFLQEYESDKDLKNYFENELYFLHAMNITLYGTSNYIDSLIDKNLGGRILHPSETILRNFHPHTSGFERGTQPYGVYGEGTSSASLGSMINLFKSL
jgi:lysyl-tRNA synthetase class 1